MSDGRIEARIKIPEGKGLWPAFWIMGNDVREFEPYDPTTPTGDVDWPACGEIDIAEFWGRRPDKVLAASHQLGADNKHKMDWKWIKSTTKFSDDVHVFGLEWGENSLAWYVYLENKKVVYFIQEKGADDWDFDHSFHVLLNLAVGGDFDGDPDETTVFPAKLEVDWVRYSPNTTVQ